MTCFRAHMYITEGYFCKFHEILAQFLCGTVLLMNSIAHPCKELEFIHHGIMDEYEVTTLDISQLQRKEFVLTNCDSGYNRFSICNRLSKIVNLNG